MALLLKQLVIMADQRQLLFFRSNVCSVAIKSSGRSGIRAQTAVNYIMTHSSLSGGVTVAVLGDGECAIQRITSSQSKDLYS